MRRGGRIKPFPQCRREIPEGSQPEPLRINTDWIALHPSGQRRSEPGMTSAMETARISMGEQMIATGVFNELFMAEVVPKAWKKEMAIAKTIKLPNRNFRARKLFTRMGTGGMIRCTKTSSKSMAYTRHPVPRSMRLTPSKVCVSQGRSPIPLQPSLFQHCLIWRHKNLFKTLPH